LKEKSWVDELKDYCDSIISDEEFEEERKLYSPMPMFKDALYLRRLYNKHYGSITPQLIPHYWVPNWTGQENPDSSARVVGLMDQDSEHAKIQKKGLFEQDFAKVKLLNLD